MDKFNGIELFTIERDGCLNGIYANQDGDATISNEVAKKQQGQNQNELIGLYDYFYFEGHNQLRGELTISSPKKNVFHCLWNDVKGNPSFEGIGYLMRENLLAVNYWSV